MVQCRLQGSTKTVGQAYTLSSLAWPDILEWAWCLRRALALKPSKALLGVGLVIRQRLLGGPMHPELRYSWTSSRGPRVQEGSWLNILK